MNKYFDNQFAAKYEKGFVYKDVSEYKSLKEWLDNTFLSMNENSALRKSDGNHLYIHDKRLGTNYSRMRWFITNEQEQRLRWNEAACLEFLTTYFILMNKITIQQVLNGKYL